MLHLFQTSPIAPNKLAKLMKEKKPMKAAKNDDRRTVPETGRRTVPETGRRTVHETGMRTVPETGKGVRNILQSFKNPGLDTLLPA